MPFLPASSIEIVNLGLLGLSLRSTKAMIFNPAHPGEVLRNYLGDLGIKEAASCLGVTRAHLSRILNGHAGISAAMSLRLSAALGTSPKFWVRMQVQHDLWQAQRAKQAKVRRFPHMPKHKDLVSV
jgi:addiction module HigA family antidote